MATLSAEQLGEIHTDVMRLWSDENLATPITKAQLTALLGIIDPEVNTAEQEILDAIPAGPEKAWLTSNPHISRRLITMVADKRREVL